MVTELALNERRFFITHNDVYLSMLFPLIGLNGSFRDN